LVDNEIFAKIQSNSQNAFLTIDARSILRSKQFSGLDAMTHQEKKQFQKIYLEEKLKKENHKTNYLTDRSFVDLAAYWHEINSETCAIKECSNYYNTCQVAVLRYDIHFYFPFGIIDFNPDSYRSSNLDYNRRIDNNILYFLSLWDIDYIVMNESNIDSRVNIVLNKILELE